MLVRKGGTYWERCLWKGVHVQVYRHEGEHGKRLKPIKSVKFVKKVKTLDATNPSSSKKNPKNAPRRLLILDQQTPIPAPKHPSDNLSAPLKIRVQPLPPASHATSPATPPATPSPHRKTMPIRPSKSAAPSPFKRVHPQGCEA
jgi:hypothetical protein